MSVGLVSLTYGLHNERDVPYNKYNLYQRHLKTANNVRSCVGTAVVVIVLMVGVVVVQ